MELGRCGPTSNSADVDRYVAQYAFIRAHLVRRFRFVRSSTELPSQMVRSTELAEHRLEGHNLEQEHDAARAWLSSLDFAGVLATLIRAREPDTGAWFLDSPEFLSWLDSDDGDVEPTLLGYGMLGAEKSVMTAIVVENLQDYAKPRMLDSLTSFVTMVLNSSKRAENCSQVSLRKFVSIGPSLTKSSGFTRSIRKAVASQRRARLKRCCVSNSPCTLARMSSWTP